MIKFLAFAAAAGLFLALPAAAQPSPRAAGQCFAQRDIQNYAAQDDYTVNLRIGRREVYQVKTVINCPDAGFGAGLAYQSRGSMICDALDLTLITRSNFGPRECPVKSLRRLTPAEVAALPKRARP